MRHLCIHGLKKITVVKDIGKTYSICGKRYDCWEGYKNYYMEKWWIQLRRNVIIVRGSGRFPAPYISRILRNLGVVGCFNPDWLPDYSFFTNDGGSMLLFNLEPSCDSAVILKLIENKGPAWVSFTT